MACRIWRRTPSGQPNSTLCRSNAAIRARASSGERGRFQSEEEERGALPRQPTPKARIPIKMAVMGIVIVPTPNKTAVLRDQRKTAVWKKPWPSFLFREGRERQGWARLLASGLKPSSRLLPAFRPEWLVGGRNRLQRRDRVRFSRTSVSAHPVAVSVIVCSLDVLFCAFLLRKQKGLAAPHYGTARPSRRLDTAPLPSSSPAEAFRSFWRNTSSGFRPQTFLPPSPSLSAGMACGRS